MVVLNAKFSNFMRFLSIQRMNPAHIVEKGFWTATLLSNLFPQSKVTNSWCLAYFPKKSVIFSRTRNDSFWFPVQAWLRMEQICFLICGARVWFSSKIESDCYFKETSTEKKINGQATKIFIPLLSQDHGKCDKKNWLKRSLKFFLLR